MPAGPNSSKNAACGLTAGTSGATTSITSRQKLAYAPAFDCIIVAPTAAQCLGQFLPARIEPHHDRAAKPTHGLGQSICKTCWQGDCTPIAMWRVVLG